MGGVPIEYNIIEPISQTRDLYVFSQKQKIFPIYIPYDKRQEKYIRTQIDDSRYKIIKEYKSDSGIYILIKYIGNNIDNKTDVTFYFQNRKVKAVLLYQK